MLNDNAHTRCDCFALGLLYFAVWSPVLEWNKHESLLLPCANPRLHTSCNTHPDYYLHVALDYESFDMDINLVSGVLECCVIFYLVVGANQSLCSSDHDLSLP
jgi:hypothetical protein